MAFSMSFIRGIFGSMSFPSSSISFSLSDSNVNVVLRITSSELGDEFDLLLLAGVVLMTTNGFFIVFLRIIHSVLMTTKAFFAAPAATRVQWQVSTSLLTPG